MNLEPAAPEMAGLSWRPIGEEDLLAAVELAMACQRVDGGLAFLNEPDSLRGRYFPDGPGMAIGGFAEESGLAACATVHRVHRAGAERAVIVGQVRPEWRGRGLGGFLMDWSLAQADALLADVPVGQRLMQVATETLTDAADHLYRVRGFEPVMEERVMRRDLHRPLPRCPLPPGVTVTTWQPGLEEQFFQAYDGSFRDRPGFPGYSAAEWIAQQVEDDDGVDNWSLLALAGEVPVGFLTAGKGDQGGFVYQMGVVPEMRRRGLASALLVESMRRMKADGAAAAGLGVNANNPGAFTVYKGLGFVVSGRRARYERMG